MFIVLEGSDACGKSTIAQHLVEELKALGHEVVHTREPGGSPYAEEVRTLVLSSKGLAANTQMLLFFSARLDHIEKTVRPAIEAGKIVVCERYVDSSYAYQVSGSGGSEYLFKHLEDHLETEIKPNYIFFLDVSLENMIKRLGLRKDGGELDEIEKKFTDTGSFFWRVREGFLKRREMRKDLFKIINANQELDAVKQEFTRWAKVIHEVQGTDNC